MKKYILFIIVCIIVTFSGYAQSNWLYSSNSYYRLIINSVPDSKTIEFKILLNDPIVGSTYEYHKNMDIKFVDGTTLKINNIFTKGNFLANLDEKSACKLATVDIMEISIGNFTFKLNSNSAEILKKAGVANGILSSSSQSSSSKSATNSNNKVTSGKFKSISIKKGLVVNGKSSIEVDCKVLINNGVGKKFWLCLWFTDKNKNYIINDGDKTTKKGVKYFISGHSFNPTNSSEEFSNWWKVYLNRLNIPAGESKIYTILTLIDENGKIVSTSPTVTINLNNKSDDTYTYN